MTDQPEPQVSFEGKQDQPDANSPSEDQGEQKGRTDGQGPITKKDLDNLGDTLARENFQTIQQFMDRLESRINEPVQRENAAKEFQTFLKETTGKELTLEESFSAIDKIAEQRQATSSDPSASAAEGKSQAASGSPVGLEQPGVDDEIIDTVAWVTQAEVLYGVSLVAEDEALIATINTKGTPEEYMRTYDKALRDKAEAMGTEITVPPPARSPGAHSGSGEVGPISEIVDPAELFKIGLRQGR